MTDFYTYYESIGKSLTRSGEAVPSGSFEFKILKCDDNEFIDIPDGAVIMGAYWGDPKIYKKGKDITKQLISKVRKENHTRIFANDEWWGDPWFGTRKTLQIKVALKKEEETKKPIAPVNAIPAATNVVTAVPTATSTATAVPTYPTAATATAVPTYPAAYPAAVPAVRPVYPAAVPAARPVYPAAVPAVRPAYPVAAVTATARPAYPAAAVTATARPAYPAAYPATAATVTYPANAVARPVAASPPRPNLVYPTRAAAVSQPIVSRPVVVAPNPIMGRQIYGNAMMGRPVVVNRPMVVNRPVVVPRRVPIAPRSVFVSNPRGGGRQMTVMQINQEINQLKMRRRQQGQLFQWGQMRLRSLKMARRQLGGAGMGGGRAGYGADAAW